MTVNILIVEDEGIVALDLEQKLKSLGHTVIGLVSSGEDALKAVRKDKVDLIFMDICLKGKLNGIQTALMIKKEWDIPIIYNSAYSDFRTRENIKENSHDEYLVKPFDDAQLQEAINTILKL